MLTKVTLVILTILGSSLAPSTAEHNISHKEHLGRSDERFSILNPHIAGGARIENLYYQISLRYQLQKGDFDSKRVLHFCGGSLIRSNIVLSAAHCRGSVIELNIKKDAIWAVAGTNQLLYTDAVLRRVDSAYIPGNYDSATNLHDIAIFKLANPFPLDGVKIGLIALRQDEAIPGTVCMISGWRGKETAANLDDGLASNYLQAANVPIMPMDQCKEAYRDKYKNTKIQNGMMCAGYLENGGVDTCRGDSGGPLVCGGQLTGVVSSDFGCGRPGYPGVYSSVAYYKRWIEETIKNIGGDTNYVPGGPIPTVSHSIPDRPHTSPTPRPSKGVVFNVGILTLLAPILTVIRLARPLT